MLKLPTTDEEESEKKNESTESYIGRFIKLSEIKYLLLGHIYKTTCIKKFSIILGWLLKGIKFIYFMDEKFVVFIGEWQKPFKFI